MQSVFGIIQNSIEKCEAEKNTQKANPRVDIQLPNCFFVHGWRKAKKS